MELKQLKYFMCVAELGSFSKAAVQLSVAQPILSRQIRSLEHDLGAELFYRNGRGIVLSEAGKLLEAYAREIIQTAGKASFEIMAMKAAPRGRITIAMPPSIGWVLTVPLVLRCRGEFPMIALHVVEGFSGHVTEWLSTGRIDIGVVYNAPRLPSLLTEPLLEEQLVLLGPANDPAGVGKGPVPAARFEDIPPDPAGAAAWLAAADRPHAGESRHCRQRSARARCHGVDPRSGRGRRRLYDLVRCSGATPGQSWAHPLLADRSAEDDPTADARHLDPAADQRGHPCRRQAYPGAGFRPLWPANGKPKWRADASGSIGGSIGARPACRKAITCYAKNAYGGWRRAWPIVAAHSPAFRDGCDRSAFRFRRRRSHGRAHGRASARRGAHAQRLRHQRGHPRPLARARLQARRFRGGGRFGCRDRLRQPADARDRGTVGAR